MCRFSFVIVSKILRAGLAQGQEVLPLPEKPFTGKVGLTYKDSEAVKPQLKIPETFRLKHPPNIPIVLIVDGGFDQMGTFGGGIPTPTMDRTRNHRNRHGKKVNENL